MTAAIPAQPDAAPSCRYCGAQIEVRQVPGDLPLLAQVRICPVCDRVPATPEAPS